MRLLLDVSHIHRRSSGYDRASREFLRALVTEQEAHEINCLGLSLALDRRAIRDLMAPGSRRIFLSLPGGVRRWYFQRCSRPALERLVPLEYDIFQSMEPFVPPGAKPTVACVYDLEVIRHPEMFPDSMQACGERVLKAVQKATAVIVPSRFVQSELESLLPEAARKAIVIPWAVSPVFNAKRVPSDRLVAARYHIAQPYLLFVGTIEPRKNLKALLEAMEALHARHSSFPPLVIVGGKGWKCQSELVKIKELSAKGFVTFRGMIPDQDLASLYRLAMGLVYPSQTEGFGLPVLEAMACGTPVVTSQGSALAEVASSETILIRPAQPGAITSALERLVDDSELRSAMTRSGLVRSAEFTHARMCRLAVQLYESLTGHRAA